MKVHHSPAVSRLIEITWKEYEAIQFVLWHYAVMADHPLGYPTPAEVMQIWHDLTGETIT